MTMSAEIDTTSLPAEQGQQLDDMINASGFFDLPREFTTSTPGADRFQYQVSIENNRRKHTVRMNEAAIPLSLKPLVNQLTKIARHKRLSKK